MTINKHNVFKNNNKLLKNIKLKNTLYVVKTIKQSKSNIIYTFRIFEIKQELTARNHNYNKTCERKTLLNKKLKTKQSK